MTTQHHDNVDPSVTAWASLGRVSQKPEPEIEAPQRDLPWRWGWNWFIGVHYGPIPVGLIVALPILIALRT